MRAARCERAALRLRKPPSQCSIERGSELAIGASDQFVGHACSIGRGSSRKSLCGPSSPKFFPSTSCHRVQATATQARQVRALAAPIARSYCYFRIRATRQRCLSHGRNGDKASVPRPISCFVSFPAGPSSTVSSALSQARAQGLEVGVVMGHDPNGLFTVQQNS